ncbi:Sugar phosphate isomerase/epimerase [Amycolatopsis arida]|uniref:Sugar phosphate isomerase/epimerase n=1 Tax=Amycolatopsis arida TaxID=587909 RepID=A0A1I5YW55_9PSEU|nr:sugar phosphate isomerase/epimerase family protein [Amycolatopsis arida]TDX89935.1 sugar phosphate isomerase/epimerase [Amycolatopsis arida]SFQ48498.1 Sugar phosphate isomerase/epimerase [Amycolatopsis arida]
MFALACQEQLLPGDTLERKWEFATANGYSAIELRGRGDLAFRDRLPELRRAAAHGVVMPTVCVEMAHFLGAFDAELRRDAIAQLRSQLSVVADIGGRGVMTPATYGMFSRRLPPFEPPRSPEEDREVLLAGLAELGEHAAREGVRLYLEPLNRYEDHMVNRLDQAAELVRATGLDSVQVAADTYHMNIEEDDPAAALLAVAPYLGHVQVSESNRCQPGTGHLDWPAVLGALAAAGYDGYLALECRPRGEPAAAVAAVPTFLRRAAG